MKRGSDFLALCVLAVAAVCVLGGTASAAEAKYRWKFANTLTQPHVDEYFRKFCDKVTEYSNGQITIRFYPDNQLGTHDEIFHGVQEGSIQLAQIAPYVHIVPGGAINWMPWTISSWKQFNLAFEVKNGPQGPLAKLMPLAYNEVGMHPLFYRSYGGYGIGNRTRELKKPDDFKGLKFRVSGSLGSVRTLENMCKGTGATFETMPFGEAYNALSKGVVDAVWAHWPQLFIDRHAEVLNHFTELNWLWDCNGIVINLELWESLPDELKAAITRAAEEIQPELSAAEEKAEKELADKVRKQMPNLKISQVTEAERDVFRQKANMPAVWDELCKPWFDKNFPGQNMTEKLQKELEEIRVKAGE